MSKGLLIPSPSLQSDQIQLIDHKKIYEQEAAQYQRLVSREDFQGNLLSAILDIIPADNLDVIDLGAGTGRLSCLLVPFVNSLNVFDLSPHMLEVASACLAGGGYKKWQAAAVDHRHIPLQDGSVDLVISGWSLCYLVVWEEDKWETELEKGLAEIRRVLRSNGAAIIIETLGTGTETPEPPDKLHSYFEYLDGLGFQKKWIRTDYRFESQDEAQELTEFFFGEEMLDKIQPGINPVLPECTGIWWKMSQDN